MLGDSLVKNAELLKIRRAIYHEVSSFALNIFYKNKKGFMYPRLINSFSVLLNNTDIRFALDNFPLSY